MILYLLNHEVCVMTQNMVYVYGLLPRALKNNAYLAVVRRTFCKCQLDTFGCGVILLCLLF